MNTIFETNRLLIRELVIEDLPAFHEMQGNPNVMRFVGTPPMTLDENREDLKKVINAYQNTKSHFNVWASLTKENSFIGTIALLKNDKEEWEIGYRLLESAWGNGYGSELTQGLIHYAFNILNLPSLVAYADKENKASIYILNKYMNFINEFWNKTDQCVDRKYELKNLK
ncbi:GNAT family N-acetyltransferase [Ascidiimonas sp. W6]|uniref:GNAT family N-acetyltransferase n=1 Tax=Ascidiimonas meishanensis TaxID=3128903 RepID=UPI0030EE11E8